MKFVTAANFTLPCHREYSPDTNMEIYSDFVISRKSDGSVLSLYKDDIWDLSPYSPRRCIFSFTSWAEKVGEDKKHLAILLQNDAKRLMWHKMFTPIRKGRKTKPASFIEWFTIMRKILHIALNLDLTLEQCVKDPRFRISLRSSLSQCQQKTLTIAKLFLQDVLSICMKYEGSCPQMIISSEQLNDYIALIKKTKKIKCNYQRTPLIPSRIMASLIYQALEKIVQLYPYKDKLLALSKRYWDEKTFFCESFYASLERGGSRSTKQKLISPVQALAEYGLTGIVNISADQPKATLRFNAWLARHLSLARILVHAFTGMRDHEVRVMSHDCFEKIIIPGIGPIPLIKSYSSKLEIGNYSTKPLYWATSNELEGVIDLAKILSLCQILFQTRGKFNIHEYDLKNTPLWASNKSTVISPVHYDLNYVDRSTWLITLQFSDTISMPQHLLITDQDRAELETFDAFNNWTDTGFSTGKQWPFATHQFRRSVAVYAARSGMVSLPSLGTQFKHLSLTMTQLYAENSAFAQNFVRDQNGAISEEHKVVEYFDYAKALNKAIALEEHVINTSHKLTGARGLMVQRLKDKGELINFLGDRDEITRKMLSGELSYIETDVGGCMRKTLCSKYGVSLVVPCVSGCNYALIGGDGGKKLRGYKESLEFALNDLDKDSRPYQSLQKEINRISVKLIEINNEDDPDEC